MYTQNDYNKCFAFLQNIRMSTSSISFNDKKIKKNDFYNKNKKKINISDIDINKILVSKKETWQI